MNNKRSASGPTLLQDGHRVTVWNRTSTKAELLVRDGAASGVRPGVRGPESDRLLPGQPDKCLAGSREEIGKVSGNNGVYP